MPRASPALFFCLFALSGFSGLIYESIWSQYLKLYLGHAAYAQALVLGIFMGGMSLGAWFCGAVIHRVRNPILVYAAVEGCIGLAALLFDAVFRTTTAFVLETVLPELGATSAINYLKWAVAAALILPQCMLLGATFPLMSNGLLRLFPAQPGRTLGMLYFTNSMGGALGILASGFLLIRLMGLPGTVLTAGLANILLAIVVYGLARDTGAAPAALQDRAGAPGQPRTALEKYILAAALITGLSSFIYEIAWIRMLSMVLGSSTHAFELMVSAFITGLAIGGFIVRKRMASGPQSLLRAGYIQVLMGLAAFATVPLYNGAFDLMSWFMHALSRSDDGYPLFNFVSHGIALAAMLPATILAGMTLPLFTSMLLERGHGERSVGQVYAVNTLGAIAGTVLTLFLLMPLLGLELAMFAGSALDVALGIGFFVLAARGGPALQGPLRFGAAAAVCLVVVSAVSGPDLRRMASGVFRTGVSAVADDARVAAHFDGATASVTVLRYADRSVSILTNGKPDASAVTDTRPPRLDEPTMVLAAALPLALKPDARRIAVIGFGSGMTTHTLLTVPSLERVDTVEIERAMYEGARHFGPRSELAFSDSRSHVYFEDAKTFFYGRRERYDVIVSEPSNPWVSGIASLFTAEFYASIRRFLEEDGILVQWIHAYETDELLVASILKALSRSFPDYHVYASNHTDLLVVAGMQADLPEPSADIFRHPRLRQELERVNIRTLADLKVRFLADRDMLAPWLQESPAPANSDYFPFVDQRAARTLFTRERFPGLHDLRLHAVPILLAFRPATLESGGSISPSDAWSGTGLTTGAQAMAAGSTPPGAIPERMSAVLPALALLREGTYDCGAAPSLAWEHALLDVMITAVGYLDPVRTAALARSVTPACDEEVHPPHPLLQLLRAYAHRDFQALADVGRALLADSSRYDSRQREFIYSSLLLGQTATRQYLPGLATWEAFLEEFHAHGTLPPFPMRLLRDHLLAGLSAPQG